MLHIKNLSLIRGGRTLIQNLSLNVEKGELLLLKGANGAGKSSLLKAIAGFLPVQTGEMELSPLHYLGHENGLKAALSVYENLEFWQAYYEGEGNINNALQQLNLMPLAHFPTRLLSQGQKRRLALAKLNVAYRPLWLLDEPQVGLDASSQGHFEQLLHSHLETGGSVIMASHEDVSLPHNTLNLGGL